MVINPHQCDFFPNHCDDFNFDDPKAMRDIGLWPREMDQLFQLYANCDASAQRKAAVANTEFGTSHRCYDLIDAHIEKILDSCPPPMTPNNMSLSGTTSTPLNSFVATGRWVGMST